MQKFLKSRLVTKLLDWFDDISTIYSILNGGATIVSILLTIAKITTTIVIFDQVFSIWKMNPFIDIQVSESSIGCPTGYEYLTSYDFYGYGGNYAREFNRTMLYSWGKSSTNTGLSICGHRNTNYTLINDPNAANCPNLYTACGGPDSDTIFCMPNGTPCPITSITISENTCSSGQLNCYVLDATKNKILTWDTGANLLPIVQSSISEYGICANYKVEGITPDRRLNVGNFRDLEKYSEYLNITDYACDMDFSTNYSWFIVDSITERYLYQINGIYADVESYEDVGDYEYDLFMRRYLNIKAECRSGVISLEPDGTVLLYVLYWMMTFTYVFSTLSTFFILITFCFKKKCPKRFERQCKNEWCISKTMDFTDILFKAGSFIVSRLVFRFTAKLRSCTKDPLIESILDTAEEIFGPVNLVVLLLFGVSCLTFFGGVLFKYRKNIINSIKKCRNKGKVAAVESTKTPRSGITSGREEELKVLNV